jgi:hypothetical protein
MLNKFLILFIISGVENKQTKGIVNGTKLLRKKMINSNNRVAPEGKPKKFARNKHFNGKEKKRKIDEHETN